MPKQLTPEQQETMKSWFFNIFILAEIPGADRYRSTRSWLAHPAYDPYKPAAKKIIEALRYSGDRSFIRSGSTKYFKDELDGALTKLSRLTFLNKPGDWRTAGQKNTKKSADMLARYVAQYCALNDVYWDDTALSTFERDEIYKHSILGKALADFDCFVSQDSPQATKTKTVSAGTSSAGYKSKGPLSALVPTLVGKPGEKTTFSKPIYCLEADSLASGNVPCIYVIPVSTAATAVSTKEASSVKFGVANGYSYCELFWETDVEATEILKKCETKFTNSKYTNLRVAKAKPTSNGYFKVMTEFGEAYIKAVKLNEELFTTCEETSEGRQAKYPTESSIFDIEVFNEAFLNSY